MEEKEKTVCFKQTRKFPVRGDASFAGDDNQKS